jgi:hypothetical protein
MESDKGYLTRRERMESTKQPWEPMQLTYVGHVAEIVQSGGGKLSTTGGDTGEPRKQKKE